MVFSEPQHTKDCRGKTFITDTNIEDFCYRFLAAPGINIPARSRFLAVPHRVFWGQPPAQPFGSVQPYPLDNSGQLPPIVIFPPVRDPFIPVTVRIKSY
jgi:hypothetical protein